MTAPLSAFDEIQELRTKLKRCTWERDDARRGLFQMGRELDGIIRERDDLLTLLTRTQADLNETKAGVERLTSECTGLAEQVARLVRLTLRVNNPEVMAAIDGFLGKPDSGAVLQRPARP